jgi:hypothetical protein
MFILRLTFNPTGEYIMNRNGEVVANAQAVAAAAGDQGAEVVVGVAAVAPPAVDNRIVPEMLCRKPNGTINNATIRLLKRLERQTRKGARKYARKLLTHNLTLGGTEQGTELLAAIQQLFDATTVLRTHLDEIQGFSRTDRVAVNAAHAAVYAAEQAEIDAAEYNDWY